MVDYSLRSCLQRCGQLPYPAAAPPNRAVGEEETGNTESGALPIEEGAAPPGGGRGGGGG